MSTDTEQEKPVGITERIAFGKEFASSLDCLIKLWSEDLNNTTHTVKRFQYSTIKTYMWVASVVFAAQLSLYIDMATSANVLKALKITVDTNSPLYCWLSYLSLASSLAVFLFGVDTMRGRHRTSKPVTNDLEQLIDVAYDDCSKPYYECTRIQILRDLNVALTHHRFVASERGEKLRIMSWGILTSAILSLLTLLC